MNNLLSDALGSCIDDNLTPRIRSELSQGNLNVYGVEGLGVQDIPYVGKD